jgi:polyisoprenoid-binding protein YceI
MMKKIALLLLLLSSIAFTHAQTITNHSVVTFKIKNLGIYTNGTIGGLHADVHFNPADLTASTLTASVEVNTLNTDNADRDEHLKSESFFDLAKYPKITLKLVSFKHGSGNNYTGVFDLTIKDKTKPVEIPFTYVDKGNTQTFSGSFKLNRRDFGIGGSSMIMSDEVIITISAEAVK